MTAKKLLTGFIFLFLGFQLATAQTEKDTGYDQKTNISSQKVKVFPNPATRVVNILGLKNSNRAAISITDVYGNEMIQHQWEIRNQSLSIPIPNLEAGIYVVHIQSEEQKVQTKFYKQ